MRGAPHGPVNYAVRKRKRDNVQADRGREGQSEKSAEESL